MIFIDIYGFVVLKLSRGKLILRIHIHTYYVCFLPTRMSYAKRTKIRNQSTNEFALYMIYT